MSPASRVGGRRRGMPNHCTTITTATTYIRSLDGGEAGAAAAREAEEAKTAKTEGAGVAATVAAAATAPGPNDHWCCSRDGGNRRNRDGGRSSREAMTKRPGGLLSLSSPLKPWWQW